MIFEWSVALGFVTNTGFLPITILDRKISLETGTRHNKNKSTSIYISQAHESVLLYTEFRF